MRRSWLFKLSLKVQGSETVVLVEGKRDREALEFFGIENIVSISGKNYHDLAQDLSESGVKQVILLTDFDRQGEKIALRISKVLSNYGITVDTEIRELLRQEGIKFIEELKNFGGGKNEAF